jgi:hypothetical protein
MPKSYKETSASNPSRIAAGPLFVVYRKITLRRLEGVFVALGQAAAAGENPLHNMFGSYFRKWWQYINCIARDSGRRKRRKVPYGRHSEVAGSQGSGLQVGQHDNKAER